MPSDLPRDPDKPDARDDGRARRAADRILSHWQRAQRNGETIPSLRDLELDAHEDVSNESFLLRKDLTLSAPVFILCGNAACTALNLIPVSRTLESAIPPSIRSRIGEDCRRAFEEGQPIRTEGSYRNDENQEMRYRSIFTPVRSRTGDDTGYVFGTFGQKGFPAAA